MGNSALVSRVWDLWTTGKRPEIRAVVEGSGDSQAVLTEYLTLQRDLYWGKRSLEASLAVSRWGVEFARSKGAAEAENVLLYNFSTFTLPWWVDSLDATACEREEGLRAAEGCLRLRRAAGRGAADVSSALWSVGAHLLLRGDAPGALSNFNAAVVSAREAGDKALEAAALEGLGRTRLLLVPAEKEWGLETLREAKTLCFEAGATSNLKEIERFLARTDLATS